MAIEKAAPLGVRNVQVRVSPEERTMLGKLAEGRGASLQTLLRDLILSAVDAKADPGGAPEVDAKTRRIGEELADAYRNGSPYVRKLLAMALDMWREERTGREADAKTTEPRKRRSSTG